MPRIKDPNPLTDSGFPAAPISPATVQILALSGGGYRGLYTAAVLDALEGAIGKPIQDAFDVIAGTSIGGILSIGLAAGKHPSELRSLLETKGSSIFRPKSGKGVRRLVDALYDAKDLESAVAGALGPDAQRSFGDVDHPLLVTAVSRMGARPWIFESVGLAGAQASDVTMLEAAMATSAAPTFFEARKIRQDHYLDGGLIANAPDLVAIVRTAARFRIPTDRLRVLSIGTAGTSSAADAGKPPAGAYKWLDSGDLVNLTMEAQEGLSIELARSLLPAGSYWRIDRAPGPGQTIVRPMDEASEIAKDTLLGLAEKTVDDLKANHMNDLRRFLGHKRGLERRP